MPNPETICALLPETPDLLRILAWSGTLAMRARGRILLRQLEKTGERGT
jgi:hypothetical protein